jgi:curved DNA-binding protein
MPSRRGQPGDLYAEAQIKVPSALSQEERRLYKELRDTSEFDARRPR